VYHIATSDNHHITMGDYAKKACAYYDYFTFNKKMFPSGMTFVKSRLKYEILRKLTIKYPLKLADFVAKAPLIGRPDWRDKVD